MKQMKQLDNNRLNETISWWEKKRIIFNIIIGFFGILALIIIQPSCFGWFDCIGILLWGIMANILFSLGILLEIANQYYFKSKYNVYQFRNFFYVIGTLAYAFVTFSYPFLYYIDFKIMNFL